MDPNDSHNRELWKKVSTVMVKKLTNINKMSTSHFKLLNLFNNIFVSQDFTKVI